MGWNPYTDQKNNAFIQILTSLFPEQAKTLPRIIIWSIIFMADLIGVCVMAVHWGIFDVMNMKTVPLVVGAAVIFLFWLQGKIFYTIANLFK